MEIKIKNTSKFIENILEKDIEINPILNDTNELFQVFHDKNALISEYIKTVGRFTDTPELQIIFELIQNADDVNNDKHEGVFGLFYNKTHLLAINNGKPFSLDNEKNDLRSFISEGVGKGNRGEKDVTGKYGKGSKLLYNLFLETNEYVDKEEAKINAFIQKLKGPIIYSWHEAGQLSTLRNFEKTDNFVLQEYNSSYPLLTKIIKTHYPAFPNEKKTDDKNKEVSIFDIEETFNLSKFLKAKDDEVLKHFYDRGSLIFIELSKNEYDNLEKIKDKYKSAISNFLHFSKNLKYLYLNDERIDKPSNLYRIDKKTQNPTGKEYYYEIIFPDDDELLKQNDFINFYNLLPVPKEKHGLNFIINTNVFELTDTREFRNSDKSYSKARFDEIKQMILEYIKNDKNSFEERLMLYKAVVTSKLTNEAKDDVRDFYDTLLNELKLIAPTNDSFVKTEEVYINVSTFDYDIAEFEPTKKWLSTQFEIFKDVANEILGIPDKTLYDVLSVSDSAKVKAWIKKMKIIPYAKFIEEFISNFREEPDFKTIPFVKINKEVNSLKEIESNPLYFIAEDNELENLITPFQAKIAEKPIQNYKLNVFFENINDKLINLFNKNKEKLNGENKIEIIEYLKNIKKIDRQEINKLTIFKNGNNEYKQLNKLFYTEEIYLQDLVKLFLLSDKFASIYTEYLFNENKLPEKIKENWNVIKQNLQNNLSEKRVDYYNSFSKIFEKGCSLTDIYISNSNRFIDRNNFFVHEKLKEIDKNIFENVSNLYSHLSFPEFEYLKYHFKKPFNYNANVKLLAINKPLEKTQTTDLIEFINTIYGDFFEYFCCKQIHSGKYSIVLKKEENKIQYTSSEDLLNKYLDNQQNYFLLPSDFNYKSQNIKKDTDIIEELIEEFGSEKEFINVVEKSTSHIKTEFLNGLEIINFNTKNEYTKQSFEYLVLNLALLHNIEIKNKISINNEILNENNFDDTVIVENVSKAFSLSKLIKKYEISSTNIKNIKDKFEKLGIKNIFDFRKKSSSEVLKELNSSSLTPYQLCFKIANKIEISQNLNSYFNSELMQYLFEYELNEYSKYYNFPDFIPNKKIYTKKEEYLLDCEKIPNWIKLWINEEEEKENFLKNCGLKTYDGIVKFREKFNDEYSRLDNIKNEYFINNTLEFCKNIYFTEKGKDNIKRAILFYVRENKKLPNYLLCCNLKNEKIEYQLELKKEINYCYFKDINRNNSKLIDLLKNKSFNGWKLLNIEYSKNIEEEIKELKIIPEFDNSKKVIANEWNEKYYANWIKNNKKYRILITKSNIPLNYFAELNNNKFLINSYSDGEFSFFEKEGIKYIYLNEKYIKEQNKPILLILEEIKGKIGLDSNDLLKLNKEYITINEQVMNIVNENNLNEKDLHEFVANRKYKEDNGLIGNYSFKHELSKDEYDNLNRLDFNDFKELVKNPKEVLSKSKGYTFTRELSKAEKHFFDKLLNLDKVLLDKLSGYDLDKIKSLTEKPEKEIEEKEEDAVINKLNGYIGEIAFSEYLKLIGEDSEHVSETKGQKEFDFIFKNKNKDFLFEVKTTIKSVIEQGTNAVPFYIHKHQYHFIKNEKPENYYIARLSLTDLNLKELVKNYSPYKQDIPNEIKQRIKDLISSHFANEANKEKLKDTIMIFKIKYDVDFQIQLK